MSEDGPARKFNKNVSSGRTDFVNSFNASFNIDTNKTSNERPGDSTRTQGTKLITSHALLSPVEQSKCIDSTIADNLRCNGRLQSDVCHMSENIITTTKLRINCPLPDLLAKGSPTQPRTNSMVPLLPQMMHTSEGPLCVLASLPQRGKGDASVKQLTKEADDGSSRTCNSKASCHQVESLFHASKNESFNLDRNQTSFNESTPTKYTQSMLSHALVNTADDLRCDEHTDSPSYPNSSPLVANMSSPLARMPHTTEAKPKKKLDMIALRALAALESSDISSSSEDDRDTKDSQHQERNLLTKKTKESYIHSMPSEKQHTSCRTSDPLGDPLSAPVMQLETFDPSHVLNDCCRRDLKPAMIPRDPLDDNWNDSAALEKEIAWLVEESYVLLPASASVFLSENKSSHPIVLAYAWRHGSLELREKILSTFPSKCCTLLKKLNGVEGNTDIDLTLIDGIDMIKSCAGSQPDSCNEEIIRLRKEACSALRLGYRRSECIERELNEIQGLKWREAVEEVGEPGDGKWSVPTKQRRQWRKRPRNDALLQTALGQSLASPSCSQSDAEVAQQIPSVLSPIEDEVAWLAEESLILLPKHMNDSESPFSTTKIDSTVSAGLVTQCEINWDYVARNASENLKDELVRIGGIKRRPLQRIVRFHQTDVRVAFQKRRSDISLLLFRGYRRNETKLSLPSHELLVETGLLDVWAVRQMRRRQNEAAEDSASANELRLACNARLGDTQQPAKNPKRQKSLSHTTKTPHIIKFAIDKARSSILTVEEEEIAWLREEYEFETGEKCYNWDYIEENASLLLLVGLVEKSCAPSSFPSAPGISRLRAMVRLAVTSVEESFKRKRLDIRYAITRGGFRRDRSAKYLPEIPVAPTSSDPPFVRKNGTSVLAIEYPFADCESNEIKNVNMTYGNCKNDPNDECQIGRMKGETVAIFDEGSVSVAADDSDSDEYELSTDESEDD